MTPELQQKIDWLSHRCIINLEISGSGDFPQGYMISLTYHVDGELSSPWWGTYDSLPDAIDAGVAHAQEAQI